MLREWALSTCVAAVVGGMAYIIIPKSGMEKILKLTVNVFFLCCVFSSILPGSSLMAEIELDSSTSSDQTRQQLEQSANDYTQQTAAASVQRILSEYLTEKGITAEKIQVNINTDGQSSISINNVVVQLADTGGYTTGEVKAMLENRYELDFQVMLMEKDDQSG